MVIKRNHRLFEADAFSWRAGSRYRRWHRARHAVLVAPLFALGCAQSSALPADDGEQIVAATLRVLSPDGHALCVDDRTTGQPLAIYATMRVAPTPSRRPLAWYEPGPLQPPPALSTNELYRDTIGTETAHLREPGNETAPLPAMTQHRLDADATALAATHVGSKVLISSRWQSGVIARWWPLNRLSRNCSPTYALSNPIWSGSRGYVSVLTEHWGTTYAFEHGPGGWKAVGQWTNWLY